MAERPWHDTHDGLVLLTSYMAKTGSTAKEVAEAVEKPWHYDDVYEEALRDLMEDQ